MRSSRWACWTADVFRCTRIITPERTTRAPRPAGQEWAIVNLVYTLSVPWSPLPPHRSPSAFARHRNGPRERSHTRFGLVIHYAVLALVVAAMLAPVAAYSDHLIQVVDESCGVIIGRDQADIEAATTLCSVLEDGPRLVRIVADGRFLSLEIDEDTAREALANKPWFKNTVRDLMAIWRGLTQSESIVVWVYWTDTLLAKSGKPAYSDDLNQTAVDGCGVIIGRDQADIEAATALCSVLEGGPGLLRIDADGRLLSLVLDWPLRLSEVLPWGSDIEHPSVEAWARRGSEAFDTSRLRTKESVLELMDLWKRLTGVVRPVVVRVYSKGQLRDAWEVLEGKPEVFGHGHVVTFTHEWIQQYDQALRVLGLPTLPPVVPR